MRLSGSFSLYFHFLTEETIEIIKSVVDESLDLRDFVLRIVEVSKDFPVTSDLMIFSLIHAQLYPDTWDAMLERSTDSIVLKPYQFYHNLGAFLAKADVTEFSKALDQAIKTEPEDWILFQLYSLAVWTVGEPERSKYIRLARDMAIVNPDIRRFLPQICRIELYTRRSQGDIQGAMRICDEVIEIAREYDDWLYTASTLSSKGNMVKDFDVHKGLELLDEAYSLIEKESSKRDAIYSSAIFMSLTYEALGEYDMALELVFEDFKVVSSYSDLTDSSSALIAARIYNALEQPEQSLEWLKGRSASLEFDIPQLYSTTAYALLLQGHLNQAALYLNKAHPLTIDSGSEIDMAYYLLVQGLLEFSLGNNTSAFDHIEQSLHIVDPQFQITMNSCLVALTKIEIAEIRKSLTKNREAESSGPWMTRLRKHAHEKNYPGIKMEHALLKAEYQVLINEHKAAIQTLTESLDFSDSQRVKSLRKKIVDKLKELERMQIS
jgi:tetratricopeptide (TPR) repeat protein